MNSENNSKFIKQTFIPLLIYILLADALLYFYPIIGFYLLMFLSYFYCVILIKKISKIYSINSTFWKRLLFIAFNQAALLIALFIYSLNELPGIKALFAGSIIAINFIISLGWLYSGIRTSNLISKAIIQCGLLAMLPAAIGNLLLGFNIIELALIEISVAIHLFFLTKIINNIMMKYKTT